jgi:integrase
MADHLTRNGGAFIFQIRVPRAFDPDSSLAPIRVRLGDVGRREAKRLAKLLAGAAHLAFVQITSKGANTVDANEETVTRAVQDHLTGLLPILRGLDAAGRIADGGTPVSSPQIAVRMSHAGLDGLADVAADLLGGTSALVSSNAAALSRHYQHVLEDEGTARLYLDLPPSPAPSTQFADMLQQLLASQATLQDQIAGMANAGERSRGPLFSEASAAYIKELRDAHGADYDEIGYLEHRTAIFLALVGDKPVGDYTEEDLQLFINEIAYMPANASKIVECRGADIKEILQNNRNLSLAPISHGTLKTNYVGKVKTIIRTGCRQAKIRFHLDDIKLAYPRFSRRKRQRLAPDYHRLTEIFRRGVASGELSHAMLPPLGFIAGRRLGLLTFLRGSDIRLYHDTWIAIPPAVVKVERRFQVVPYKTTESLSFFVLHNFFDRVGFIEWARGRQDAFIFASLHEGIVDPADCAQKRMSRLFKAAGAGGWGMQGCGHVGRRRSGQNEWPGLPSGVVGPAADDQV